MKNNIKNIREEIISLQNVYVQVKKSLPPLRDTKQAIIDNLESRFVIPFANLRERFTSSMFSGDSWVNLPDENELAKFVFGLSITNGFITNILDSIEEELSESHPTISRMPVKEKKEKIGELLLEIYKLEIIEQELIEQDTSGTIEQRADVSGCALLGLPIEIAKSANFI